MKIWISNFSAGYFLYMTEISFIISIHIYNTWIAEEIVPLNTHDMYVQNIKFPLKIFKIFHESKFFFKSLACNICVSRIIVFEL